MKVLISDKMDPRCVEILEANDGVAVDVCSGLSPSALLDCIGNYEGLVVRSATTVTAEVIAAAPRLRVIGRAGTGFDNIDVEAATRHGIIVMNTPGGNSLSTAEHTFALIASLARHIPQATSSLKKGLWERSQFVGVELDGKTLAVLGLGRVGREVAARAAAFRMKVLGYDPYIGQEMALSYGAHLASLDEIYATADFITVHTHLSDQTRHLISDAEIAQCKDGVYLINCALDVFEEEPPTLVDLLVDDRVICTPHLAASTKEAQANVALQVAEQVGDVLMGRVIRNAVNAPSVDPEIHGKLQPYLVLAERLGRLQAQLGEGQLERITIEYQGDITAYPTSPLTSAVLKGIMETISDAAVNVVNALLFAQERGVQVDERLSSEHEDYASLITVVYHTNKGQRLLAGTIFGKSDPRLVRLDEYIFDAVPEGHMLFYINDDVPGIIGQIGTVMGSHNVNIAQMSCGRRRMGGQALTILNVDDPITTDVVDDILSREYISWAKQVSL
jgi:D-3-phosphoglycerate dehydrogenase